MKLIMKNKLADSLDVTKDIVDREITEAGIYYNLLFKLVNGFKENKKFYEAHQGVFHYIEGSLITSYVLALCKIFSSTREESLWKLLLIARKIDVKRFEYRLECFPTAPHNQLRQQRKKFLENLDGYIKKIKEIDDFLSPLRNTQRAHNFPLLSNGKEISWNQLKEWLSFAEEVFVTVMDGTCDSACRVGDFIPNELIDQMDNMAAIIKTIKMVPSR